jgi:nucleotide-binding universal stress UspA family protein
MMKILLAVDGSEFTTRVLEGAMALDKQLHDDPEYVAFTVVIAIPAYAASFLDFDTVADYYREESEKVLDPVVAFAKKHKWKFSTSYASGHAADEITKFAEAEKPDLIIMGTHGQSMLKNVILGSVSSGVLARCSFPTLLIH